MRKKQQPKFTPFISPKPSFDGKQSIKKKSDAVTLDEFTPAERAVIHRYKAALDKN